MLQGLKNLPQFCSRGVIGKNGRCEECLRSGFLFLNAEKGAGEEFAL